MGGGHAILVRQLPDTVFALQSSADYSLYSLDRHLHRAGKP